MTRQAFLFLSSLALAAACFALIGWYGDTWYTIAFAAVTGLWGGHCSGKLMRGQ